MVVVPVINAPYFSEVLTIEVDAYDFSFSWNHRANYWTLTINSDDGEVLLSGVKVMLEFDLLRRYKKEKLPRGSFLALRDGINKAKIEYDEIGNTVNILYASEEEYATL